MEKLSCNGTRLWQGTLWQPLLRQATREYCATFVVSCMRHVRLGIAGIHREAVYFLAQMVKTGIGGWPQDVQGSSPLLPSTGGWKRNAIPAPQDSSPGPQKDVISLHTGRGVTSWSDPSATMIHVFHNHSKPMRGASPVVSVTGLPWQEDEALAVGLLHAAASLGYPRAWLALGKRYELGEGVPKSPELSAYYYEVSLFHCSQMLSY